MVIKECGGGKESWRGIDFLNGEREGGNHGRTDGPPSRGGEKTTEGDRRRGSHGGEERVMVRRMN